MSEVQTIYTAKSKKMGRPKKEVKGERLWIPADCVEFVKSYLEIAKQKAKTVESEQ